MVAMNNDKGELWVLRRLKISNGNIQDLKAELAPDGQGATLRIPITCTASVSLWVSWESGSWEKQGSMADGSPTWNQALFHAGVWVWASVSQSVCEGAFPALKS